MDYTAEEVLQFVEENDVKFIRLAFCDLFGTLKNIAIMKNELPRAFEYGISFDASAVKGFMNVDEGDLHLIPDPSTLSVLPWRPQQGRVVRLFCDIYHDDGRPFEGNGRHMLHKSTERLSKMGLDCMIGPECEFYMFELDADGQPTKKPQDNAGYFDVAPKDKGENVRREICLFMEEMGLSPESSSHKQGPGQNEVDFRFSDALSAADHTIVFKSVVKTVAARNGLFASFMPKPIANRNGNGFHINLSLQKDGKNLFRAGVPGHELAEHFIAGILRYVREMTLFFNPITNSYTRFGQFEAPRYVTWSQQNHSQLIRIPSASGPMARMELRSPDPCCNPYIAFALLLEAGMRGIETKMPLPPSTDRVVSELSKQEINEIEQLPLTLGEAIEVAKDSEFLRNILTERVLNEVLLEKQSEWNAYCMEKDTEAFEHLRYFQNM